jgi:hypothetical protein
MPRHGNLHACEWAKRTKHRGNHTFKSKTWQHSPAPLQPSHPTQGQHTDPLPRHLTLVGKGQRPVCGKLGPATQRCHSCATLVPLLCHSTYNGVVGEVVPHILHHLQAGLDWHCDVQQHQIGVLSAVNEVHRFITCTVTGQRRGTGTGQRRGRHGNAGNCWLGLRASFDAQGLFGVIASPLARKTTFSRATPRRWSNRRPKRQFAPSSSTNTTRREERGRSRMVDIYRGEC